MNVRARCCLPLCLVMWIVWGLAGCASAAGIASRTGGTLSAEEQRLILVTVDNRHVMPIGEPGSTPHGYGDLAPYTVSAQARALTAALAHDYDLREVRAWPIAALKVQCVVFGVSPQTDRRSLLQRLSRDRRVRLAEPLRLFVALNDSALAPAADRPDITHPALPVSLRLPEAEPDAPIEGNYNDPYFTLQYGFQAIHAGAAQRWSLGQGIRVAIVDTGIDANHADLRGQVAVEKDFVGPTDAVPGRAHTAASSGADRHGTGVAGIVAALANNRLGIVGVAPGAKLLSFKACQPLAPGSLEARCNSFTLALALSAAIEAHADVVNLSLAGPFDALLAQLVRAGESQGMLFVGAVPEDGHLDGFPLGTDGVIAVDEWGRSATDARILHAPGSEILSLAPGNRYDFVSGSSFAAAHVSGALALLRARWPHLSTSALLASLVAHGASDGAPTTINVCAAMHALEPRDSCPPGTRVLATVQGP